jgi:predicted Ser/Thr protein kinase
VQQHPFTKKTLLKNDLFGEVWTVRYGDGDAILRDTHAARWWLAWLARGLLRREARALAALTGVRGVPQLINSNKHSLLRTYIRGVPLYVSGTDSAAYFISAARLLRRIHCAGVAHNDLAKEPNLIVCENGDAAIIDFQLAGYQRVRGRLFRAAAREDIRHLLKHKRTYRPDQLTTRERAILDSPSFASRAYMATVKPVYVFVTRRLLGWADREGAADR